MPSVYSCLPLLLVPPECLWHILPFFLEHKQILRFFNELSAQPFLFVVVCSGASQSGTPQERDARALQGCEFINGPEGPGLTHPWATHLLPGIAQASVFYLSNQLRFKLRTTDNLEAQLS